MWRCGHLMTTNVAFLDMRVHTQYTANYSLSLIIWLKWLLESWKLESFIEQMTHRIQIETFSTMCRWEKERVIVRKLIFCPMTRQAISSYIFILCCYFEVIITWSISNVSLLLLLLPYCDHRHLADYSVTLGVRMW